MNELHDASEADHHSAYDRVEDAGAGVDDLDISGACSKDQDGDHGVLDLPWRDLAEGETLVETDLDAAAVAAAWLGSCLSDWGLLELPRS